MSDNTLQLSIHATAYYYPYSKWKGENRYFSKIFYYYESPVTMSRYSN